MVCGGPPRLLKATIKRKERSKKFNTFLDLYKVATIILGQWYFRTYNSYFHTNFEICVGKRPNTPYFLLFLSYHYCSSLSLYPSSLFITIREKEQNACLSCKPRLVAKKMWQTRQQNEALIFIFYFFP